MSKKNLIIVIIVMLLSSCDKLPSFFISPGYYIASPKFGWTIDSSENRLYEDPVNNQHYTNSHNPNLYWGTNALLFQNLSSGNSLIGLGFPTELLQYNNIDSPLYYLYLFFQHDFSSNTGLDIITPVDPPSQQICLSRDNGKEIYVNYTMSVTANTVLSYTLPEPAFLGIDSTGTTTKLTGGLNILNFDITSYHNFVSGTATCVFSNTDPAGLLYLVYYHDNGLVSLIYAHDVETTETGNYFPDGHYEYIWSVYRQQ